VEPFQFPDCFRVVGAGVDELHPEVAYLLFEGDLEADQTAGGALRQSRVPFVY